MAYFDESVQMPPGIAQLFERSNVSLTIADARQEDCPLAGVNDAFCKLSGYPADEILGRNCRFLQPPQGAGPVRARMRRFLADRGVNDGKFLIPNVTKQGEPFLNLVYMAKLERDGHVDFILGSQFAVDLKNSGNGDLYDLALAEDLRQLKLLTDEHNWTVLGSFNVLASSHSIIARTRLG